MAEPTESILSSGSFEATLMGRLTRLGCCRAGELAGLAEGRHQGPRQKLQNWQIIAGLVAQCLHTGGSLLRLIRRYFAVRLSSSALSQRRQYMQFEPFATVMRHALRPMAQQQIHTDCFFAGLRLGGPRRHTVRFAQHAADQRRREQGKDAAWGGVKKQLAAAGVELLSVGIDEVPGVYKDMHSVMAAQTDLVEVLGQFQPRIVKMCPDGDKAEN